MFRSTSVRVLVIVIFALLIGYFDLPKALQMIPGTPNSIKNSYIHLGLDLQGGSQLDYKIDLRKVPEKDQKSIIDGVMSVIRNRVNGLGVAEPNIYTSTIGTEQHIVVELAGIKDLNEAKKVVGKTISLEFKEKREKEDPAHKENIRKLAEATLRRVTSVKEDFAIVGQEEAQLDPEKTRFVENDWMFVSEIDKKISTEIEKLKPGTVLSKTIEGNDGFTYKDNQFVPLDGFFIVKLLDRRDTTQLPEADKAVQVSHIQVSYRGSEGAAETVIRTREEAKTLANDLVEKLAKGDSFEKIAKESSDGTNAKDTGGKLDGAVKVIKDNSSASGLIANEAFIATALKLNKTGEFSQVVETPFGFHIIRADNFSQIKYNNIFFSTAADPWIDTGLNGQQFERADVAIDDYMRPYVKVQFNTEGAKLFEKITERNVNKPLAIFVGGKLISDPNVSEKISGGSAIITSGQFTTETANQLARDLNTGAIPAPIMLSGQYTIGPSLGEEALNKSLFAGLIGVLLLTLFMVLYYRLPGFIAILALTLYTGIMVFLIKSELVLAISLLVAIIIFVSIIYTILKSHEDGWEKLVTFVLACFILFFITFILSNAIVLTLAGIAGVILSIGMAVDANILIFERTKEELRAGRPLVSAIDVGFYRAWNSIRDSNFSSLITCAILYNFGTSIIQGFAFNLAAGILVSMFTAITITKTLLNAFMKTSLGEKLWLWGVPKIEPQELVQEKKPYRIIERTKLWFGLSGTVLLVCLISILFFQLKLGIDFKGGTLIDLSFEKNVSTDEVKKELVVIGDKIATEAKEKASYAKTTIESGAPALDFSSARVVAAGTNQYLINLEHIDNTTHELLIENLKTKFGNVTENKFRTIGATVGDDLKRQAVFAVILAMAAIVIYIAFAFRKVPKRVSPWKFGVCAIAALLHDVIIPIGVFSILQLEVDALFITAILTVLGFSVHDTIVVFDRIRENLRYQEKDESFTHVANKSMTQTFARSLNTSLTVAITLISLLVFGSTSIFNFILVLVIGIIVGTYSSIFIASPLLVLWQKEQK